ncbi:unnamed protein product [Nezara viridula]|uniref:Caspase-8 n=1 Tax=Nezara viridula TaxID=85310 RepID=A0A9P0H3A1_NEZVI|nr:unnamed protein product [Nezara viridula]
MDRINERFEDISFDAGPISSRERNFIIFLEPDMIPKIEHRFEEYEKVSFAFLFFDDVYSSLRVCEKSVNNRNYNFMSDNSLEEHSNWDKKFIECLFYVQHVLLLLKLGIGMYDAQRVFKKPKFVSKQRLLLYKICENLSNAETLQLMESIPSISPEKYLEIFILRILSLENGLNLFISSLLSLNNPVINSLLEDIKEDSCSDNIKLTPTSKKLPRPANLSADEIYPIKDPNNVGLCFIINEVNIKGEQKRDGSTEDVSLLISTMKYFNINVKDFTDVPKKYFDDLGTIIDIHFKEKNYSVFFLIIMSHGKPGVILSSDDKAVDINYITSKLHCKSLHKIPKVLIIQACQGDILLVENLATDGPSSLQFDQATQVRHKFRSHISDLLIAMSTVTGFKAFRDRKTGSWFVQALCKCMKEHENECLLSIITYTIREVKAQSVSLDKTCQIIQQPEFRSLLEKKLYLKPIINN